MECERGGLTTKVEVIPNLDPLKDVVNVEHEFAAAVFALDQAETVDSGIVPRHRVIFRISPDTISHYNSLSFSLPERQR